MALQIPYEAWLLMMEHDNTLATRETNKRRQQIVTVLQERYGIWMRSVQGHHTWRTDDGSIINLLEVTPVEGASINRQPRYSVQTRHVSLPGEVGLQFFPYTQALVCWNWMNKSGVWSGRLCESDGTIMFPTGNYSQQDMKDIWYQFRAGKPRMVFTIEDDG